MIRHYEVTPRLISRILLSVVLMLLLANLFCVFGKMYFGFSFHTIDQFYFNREGNLPTIFSFVLFIIAGVLLWIISGMPQEAQGRKRVYWKVLAVIFLFLAADELISIHETFTDDARAILGGAGQGYLYFAWIVPYAMVLGLIAILLLRFFIRLPRQTRIHFAIAACVYTTGAVGFEMITGNYVFNRSEAAKEELRYMLLVTVEELFEMTGLIIFINALLKYCIAKVVGKSAVLTFDVNDKK